MGGSENMLTEIAIELARHHEVTVRLPYAHPETSFRRVRWVGLDHPAMRGDVLFCFDDFARRDDGARTVLVATRSDPPRHSDFDWCRRTKAHHLAHNIGRFKGDLAIGKFAKQAYRDFRAIHVAGSFAGDH